METHELTGCMAPRDADELVLPTSLGTWFSFWHIMPCACGARDASAAGAGFGFALNTATTFDVFYWLQVANFDALFDSAPNSANHFHVWDFDIHGKMALRPRMT